MYQTCEPSYSPWNLSSALPWPCLRAWHSHQANPSSAFVPVVVPRVSAWFCHASSGLNAEEQVTCNVGAVFLQRVRATCSCSNPSPSTPLLLRSTTMLASVSIQPCCFLLHWRSVSEEICLRITLCNVKTSRHMLNHVSNPLVTRRCCKPFKQVIVLSLN